MSEDKVDEFLKDSAARFPKGQKKYDKFRSRRDKEKQLHKEWVAGGKKIDDPRLVELLDSMDPIIQREAKRRIAGVGGRIPIHTMKNELRNHAVTAFSTYDPTKRTQLSTHVHQNFMRVTDFVAANRNTKRMPRDKTDRYQEFQNAKMLFEEEFGRAATLTELQGMFPKWPKKTVQDMERGFGAEVFSGISGRLDGDYAEEDDLRGAFLMVRGRMTDAEKEFGEKHFPAKGKRRMEVAAIAKAMGIPEHKAYRLKKAVELKMKPLMKNR